jgi:hypothetical protein
MRLLLVLNESPAGSHVDFHKALDQLVQEGDLESYLLYPFLAHLDSGLNARELESHLLKVAEEFKPTGILWAHTSGFNVSRDTVDRLRRLQSAPSLGYHEGDLYESPYKRLPDEMISLISGCDVFFCQGFGAMTDLLRKNGCRDIRYVPPPTDEWRFGRLRSAADEIVFDVVMIGNYVSSRLPWRTMPGSRLRRELSLLLYKQLGSRFAVFGHGWSGPFAAGPIPFDQQEKAYHRSRIAVGINNLHARYYFSNRLPIAMSSGIPIVHNYEPGLEEIFSAECGAFFFEEISEAWGVIQRLLGKEQTELDEIGVKARQFAVNRFNVTEIIRYMVKVLQSHVANRSGNRGAETPRNPWVAEVQPQTSSR